MLKMCISKSTVFKYSIINDPTTMTSRILHFTVCITLNIKLLMIFFIDNAIILWWEYDIVAAQKGNLCC